MAWVRIAAVVADEYVGRSRLCPEQALRELETADDRAVIIVERKCAYSAYSAAIRLEFRVELARQDGDWVIRWAGLRLKCALNRHPLGAYLLKHNPFRSGRAAWSAPLKAAVDAFAHRLNPWMPECL
jgi:hypothetical protein